MNVRHVAPSELYLRNNGEGRTVYGLAVPFGTTIEVNDGTGPYRERFAKGAFDRTIRERGNRVKVLLNHERRKLPVGKPTVLREDDAGLYIEARLSATRDADEALELVRDGVLDAFSVGFSPIRERMVDGVVERTEVRLAEVSLVAFPAYEGALVAGVRTDSPRLSVDAAVRRLRLLELS